MKYVWDIIFWYFHIQNWRLDHYSLLINYFHADMENEIIFTACSGTVFFYISPTQNLQFFGTLFLLFFVLLIPSLTVFVSLRQRRWRLLSTISQQYRWVPRCVSAPPSFINVHLFITGLCTIYLCDAHCPCHKDRIILYCKQQRTSVIKELLIALI